MADDWEKVARAAWDHHKRAEGAYLAHYQELNEALEQAARLAQEPGQAEAISEFIQSYSAPLAADASVERQATDLMQTTLPLALLAYFVRTRTGDQVTFDDETLERMLAALTLAYMAGKAR